MNNKIILGGNLFGYNCNKKESEKLILAAFENGINKIDTSDVYTNGNSEKIIGLVLDKNKIRNKIKVFTKVGTTGFDYENCNSEKNIISKINKSLKRLKTDYIDLYQLHNFDPVTPLEETLYCLRNLKKQGKIIDYGVSNFFRKEFNLLHKFEKKKLYNQSHVNILNFENEKLNKYFKIIAYGVLGRGVISDNFFSERISKRKSYSKSIQKDLSSKIIRDSLMQLKNISIQSNMTIQQIAFNYIYKSKLISKMIIGVSNIENLLHFLKNKEKKLDLLRIKKIQNKYKFKIKNKKFLGKYL